MGFAGMNDFKECDICGIVYNEPECPDCLDDKIAEWHEGDSELTLAEFLGWTKEEYMIWINYQAVDVGVK